MVKQAAQRFNTTFSTVETSHLQARLSNLIGVLVEEGL